LHEAAQNFEFVLNIQDQNKKKNKKHIAVDVLFKAYPMVAPRGSTLMQIQSGRTVPLTYAQEITKDRHFAN
jgi:hypothetical protein